MAKPQTFTAHTFIHDTQLTDGLTLYDFFSDMGDVYGRVKRTLFRDMISTGTPSASFKNTYLKRFGITARQFNAIRYDLEGNIESYREGLAFRIRDLTDRITSVKKWVKSKETQVRKVRKDTSLSNHQRGKLLQPLLFTLHHKKRRLHAIEEKLASLQKDRDNGTIRLCFGSRTLFSRQFELAGNDYASHDEWLSDWRHARSSQFVCLGSKDETGGNQTCTLSRSGVLRIRVPDALVPTYSKYVTIPTISYPYGQEFIDYALHNGRALTHRFVRKEKGWYLQTFVDMPEKVRITNHPRDIGCIGVDVNEKSIAVAETDRYGNRVRSKVYPACVKDVSTERTRAIYGDVSKDIIERCVATGKPLGHEHVDFQKKKTALREQGATYARMLSGFAYATFLTMLDRRAYKAGVEVRTVNPAFTSVIGTCNYMERYGITVHEGAAIAIARRVQRCSERPDLSRTASPLPERIRGEHDWSFWRRLRRVETKARASAKDSARAGGPDRTSPAVAVREAEISETGTALHGTHRPKGQRGPWSGPGSESRGECIGVRVPDANSAAALFGCRARFYGGTV